MLNVLKSIILLYAVGASSSGGLFGASSTGTGGSIFGGGGVTLVFTLLDGDFDLGAGASSGGIFGASSGAAFGGASSSGGSELQQARATMVEHRKVSDLLRMWEERIHKQAQHFDVVPSASVGAFSKIGFQQNLL
eukprot:g3036.t1